MKSAVRLFYCLNIILRGEPCIRFLTIRHNFYIHFMINPTIFLKLGQKGLPVIIRYRNTMIAPIIIKHTSNIR